MAEATIVRGGAQFRWNTRAQRYIAPNGRFVSRKTVLMAAERVSVGLYGDMSSLTAALRSGYATVAEWQLGMARLVRTNHLAAAAAAAGGVAQLDEGARNLVQKKIETQLGHLEKFAKQVETGRQPLGGQFDLRVKMYSNSARGTGHTIARQVAITAGVEMARNVLGDAEHCSDCLDESAKGTVPIDELSEPGTRQCLVNCQCTIEYVDGGGGS
jgi:hypothetical protein